MNYINRALAHLLTIIRPIFGPANCPFALSCGVYALQALKKYSTIKAFYVIAKRLIACSPLYHLIDTTGLHFLE